MNKGITLVSLIITIIILIILATVGTYTGLETYEQAKVTKFVANMQAIQQKVDLIVKEQNVLTRYGIALTTEQKDQLNAIISNQPSALMTSSGNSESLRYFNKGLLKSQLELDNIDDDIIVNFQNREVISLNGVEYEEEMYYTQYNLPNGQYLIVQEEEEASLETIKYINGLMATIVAIPNIDNGILQYKEDSSSLWITLAEKTENGAQYRVVLQKSEDYNFRLAKNGSQDYVEEDITIKLANPPIDENGLPITGQVYDYSQDSSKWAYKTQSGNMYIWVPRFAYKRDDIKFIKGNSNIATDETLLDSTWTVPDGFDNENVTGKWVQVRSLGRSYNLKDLMRVE